MYIQDNTNTNIIYFTYVHIEALFLFEMLQVRVTWECYHVSCDMWEEKKMDIGEFVPYTRGWLKHLGTHMEINELNLLTCRISKLTNGLHTMQ